MKEARDSAVQEELKRMEQAAQESFESKDVGRPGGFQVIPTTV
jgi:hypothetical protein